jgi:uncharacterized membrane protein
MSRLGSATALDRIFSSLPYLLPLLDSLVFSAAFFRVFPPLQLALAPLLPVIVIYSQVPFAAIIVFFALFFLVVRNEKVPHFIRFNTMQALLVDILLVIVNITVPILARIEGLSLLVTALESTVFLGVLAIFIFSVVQSLRGIYAEIPTLSDAVYSQVQ